MLTPEGLSYVGPVPCHSYAGSRALGPRQRHLVQGSLRIPGMLSARLWVWYITDEKEPPGPLPM